MPYPYKRRFFVVRALCPGGLHKVKYVTSAQQATDATVDFQAMGCKVVSAGAVSKGFRGRGLGISPKRKGQGLMAATSCSNTNRWLRGTLGFIGGGIVGSGIGALIWWAFAAHAVADVAAGDKPGAGVLYTAIIPSTLGLAGSVGGAYLAARKPDC